MRKIVKGGFFLVRKLVKIYVLLVCIGVSARLMSKSAPQNMIPQQPAPQKTLTIQIPKQGTGVAQVVASGLERDSQITFEIGQHASFPVQQVQVVSASVSTENELPLNVDETAPDSPADLPDTDAEASLPPQISPLMMLPEDTQTVDNVVGISEGLYGWNFKSLANNLALTPDVAEQMKTRISDYFRSEKNSSQPKDLENFLAEIVPEFVGHDVAQQYFEDEAESKQIEAQERTIGLTDAISSPIGLAPEQEAVALRIIEETDAEIRRGNNFFDARLREARLAFLNGEIDEDSYLLELSAAEVSNDLVLQRTVNKLIESPELGINDQQKNDLLALSQSEGLASVLTGRVCSKVDNSDCLIKETSDNS